VQKASNPVRTAKAARRSVVLRAKNPAAGDVRVTGDFSGWSPEGVVLKKDAGGEWKATLLLEPGRYQYRLIVDGAWADHPEAASRVANPHGSENCVLEVD
jgi:hypothetical protein